MKRLSKADFLQQVKAQVLAIDPQAEVYLFGSRARNNQRRNSDWDFLVLTEKELTLQLKYDIWDMFTELELATGEIINPVVHSKQEWTKQQFSPFYWNVLEEGRPV
ncbi:nucleotidyltransferase domain-containing protein [Nibrella viscosa]